LVFADDERDANPTTFKFFQAAQAWAAQNAGGGEEPGLSYDMPSDSEDEDDEDEGEKGEDAEMGEAGEANAVPDDAMSD
jgi:crooked neck